MNRNVLVLCVLLLKVCTKDSLAQDEEGPYLGKLIGKLNSYHHQVSGEVYAVNETTLVLVNFNYDGTGDDTFFWAGDSGRPGPQGFIVPDHTGKTNILERYYNENVLLTLPEGKKISKIKWFAIYDISSQNAFGDVYIPEEFEPPAPLAIGPLVGSGPAVTSQDVVILDASTILIKEFRYDGSGGEVYFWAGVGPQPSSKGHKIPDENGYYAPLSKYNGEDIRLRISGAGTDGIAGGAEWLSVWDVTSQRSVAAVILPTDASVPPADTNVHPYRSALPHCVQLHRDVQVSWEVFGNQVTFQLAGLISEDEYMGFGISGSPDRSVMVGADVCVTSYRKQRGQAVDYNITANAPCTMVLGAWRGVCADTVLGGQDSNQLLSASRDDGLTVVTYRRTLQPNEALDREWSVSRAVPVVWAVGGLDAWGEPAYHRLYHKNDVLLNLTMEPPTYDCVPFTIGGVTSETPWETAELFDPALRVFTFTLGGSGGARGVAGRRGERGGSHAYAWYVNGQLAPDIQLRRGLHYTFNVFGGNDPHSAEWYHPLVVTTSPSPPRALAGGERVLAGVTYSRRGVPTPTAAGPLCLGSPPTDGRSSPPTFRAYNRSLTWNCPSSVPARLQLLPNSSWPDVVYYNSFTHAGMGGRIFIVDRHKRNLGRAPASSASVTVTRPVNVIVTVALMTATLARYL